MNETALLCVCVLITSSILFSCVTYICIFFFSNEKGRVDDNIETIRKRFKVFLESSMPVIEYYGSKGKVRKVMHLLCIYLYVFNSFFYSNHQFCFSNLQIDASKPVEEVFEAVKAIFTQKDEKVKKHVCSIL